MPPVIIEPMITEEELNRLLALAVTPDAPVPALSLTDEERRQHRRWQIPGMSAALYWQGNEWALPVTDISLSGLRLAASQPLLPVGERAVLICLLDIFGTLATPIEVRRVGIGTTQDIGVRFTPLHSEDLLPLMRMLNSLEYQSENPTPPDS
jgi:hypothetical protein